MILDLILLFKICFATMSCNTIYSRRLLHEIRELKKVSISEFRLGPKTDVNGKEIINEWDVTMNGTPGTVYEGSTILAELKFPDDYPFSPPKFKFITRMFHPNIYEDGDVCISILKKENASMGTEDRNSSWTPSQTARTICFSILNLINEPNEDNAANLDAARMYRDNRELYNQTVKALISTNPSN